MQLVTMQLRNTWLALCGYCWLYSCFISGLDLLSCRHPDSGCRSTQTEGSGARL